MSEPEVRAMTPEAAAALRRAAEALAEEYTLHEATRFMVVPAGDVVALFQALDVAMMSMKDMAQRLHAEGMRLQAAKGEAAKARQARDARATDEGEKDPVEAATDAFIDAILGKESTP